MSRVRIGIDIGHHTVTVAWVVRDRSGKPLWRCERRNRVPNETASQLSRTLGELLRPLRRIRFEASVILAAPHSHLRQLTAQVADPKALAHAIREQLPSLFPFEPESSICEFRILHTRRTDHQVECTALVAASDAQALEHQLQSLRRLGWIPSSACPAALGLVAIAKSVGQLDEAPCLLIEMGARSTLMVLADRGQLLFAREISLGSDHLTEALMTNVSVGERTVHLTWEEAEALKHDVGVPPPGSTPHVGKERLPLSTYLSLIQPVLEQFLGEIHRTIAVGAQSAAEAIPRTILLSGGGSLLPQFDLWLTQHLSIPVDQLELASFVGTSGEPGAVACGLALLKREDLIDLLPPSTRRLHQTVLAERWALKGMLAGIVAVWLVWGLVAMRHADVRRQLEQARSRWTTMQPVVELSGQLAAHTQVMETLTKSQGVSLAWLKALAGGLPNAVRLTELSLGRSGEAQMAAQAQAREQVPEAYVSEMTFWLQRDTLCQQVQLGTSQRNATDPDLVEFRLTCKRP